MENAVITVDGPAASGKSALCRRLALRWRGWDWLSTGVFYRGLAYMLDHNGFSSNKEEWPSCLSRNNWKVKKEEKRTSFWYNEEDVTSRIYNSKMDKLSSQAAADGKVRQALIKCQRIQKEEGRGLIAEGRDCGTVIFPQAALKIYLTAPDEVRSERRAKERKQAAEAVISAQKKRDELDSKRACNPLKKPENAWVIETNQFSLDQIEKMVHDRACREFSQWKSSFKNS